ncbi:MJ0042-type zinc finger domain-containing protein [Enhygromyxa salina]|uniref:Zinc finger/thioredoxin putative domain-containing protein n=1 Tax=Enhygromyxa salina TaxID=215803 RepID=A0A2S9YS86_9BACT|nr:MJ0042-type zinc finger domain-containing protein [Enhygromyxa salina]PRQ07948.1 hypothetical protein ENSA7_23870 [Enhygromyxa salina]
MIIACPECTSPFQVVDGQIAALVQVECPTCSFRMILDFEAANDASLREAGMKLAQGFRTEVAYREAVGQQAGGFAPHDARPELRAVPEPTAQPVAAPEPRPEPAVESRPEPVRVPTSRPTSEPVAATPPAAELESAKPPVRPRPRPRPTLIAQTAPPPVRQPTDFTPPEQPEPADYAAQAEAHISTHVGPAPQAEPGAQLESSDDGFDDGFAVDMDDVQDVEMDVPDMVPERPQPVHRPPHTPAHDSSTAPTPADATPTVALEDSAQDLLKDPAQQAGKDPGKQAAQDAAKPKKSVLGAVLKVVLLLLLLLVGGLMTWSLIVNQDPDPRRLLQEQFGVDLGVPAAPTAEQPGDASGDDDKADADGGKDDDNG